MHPHMFYIGKGTFVPLTSDKKIAIENTIHNISDHINAAQAAGFRFVQLYEQAVPADWAAKSSNYSGLVGEPLSFGLVVQKQ